MGIYIKNQEMPTSCTNCFYAVHCEKCVFKNILMKGEEVIYHIGTKPKDCPLVEIEDIKDYVK